MRILGVLPLAGSGTRLGAKFHKALMPIPFEGKLKPVVEFSIDRLRIICDDIVAVTSPDSQYPFPTEEFQLPNLVKESQGEFATSFALAAAFARENGFTHIAASLPDTLWFPEDAFRDLVNTLLEDEGGLDGVLGLFHGDKRMLDEVEFNFETGHVSNIRIHLRDAEPYSEGWGWGIFILRVEKAIGLNDVTTFAEQLKSMKLSSCRLDGTYMDIGTPERYRRAINLIA